MLVPEVTTRLEALHAKLQQELATGRAQDKQVRIEAGSAIDGTVRLITAYHIVACACGKRQAVFLASMAATLALQTSQAISAHMHACMVAYSGMQDLEV